jgi:UDP-N-acetylmuramate--alanine ligase
MSPPDLVPSMRVPSEEAPPLLRPGAHYHFVGIGGVGMSALAELLHRRGYRVSGSDRQDGDTLRRLAALGIPVRVGHDPAELAGADAMVFTAAVRPEHPLRQAAAGRGLLQLHRAALLAAVGGGQRLLAVSGTHGKTTSSGALAEVWCACGRDPTALVGGDVLDWGRTNLRLGGGEWMVAEADESDESFLLLRPEAILLTNAEPDHLDHHGTGERVRQAFAAFLARLPEEGVLVYCMDDPVAAGLGQRHAGRAIAYGRGEGAQVRVRVIGMKPGATRIQIADDSGARELTLALGGAHNALNLTGVYALARAYGLPERPLLEALATYRGVARRQEWIGEARGYRVFDDYAHHPSEIRATLEMFLTLYGPPVTVVFQPHLYSRTAHFADAFAEALRPATRVFVTEVYGAREAPQPGVSGRMIVERMRGHPAAEFLPDWRDFPAHLARERRVGGVLLTLGAGDITGLGPLLLRGQTP